MASLLAAETKLLKAPPVSNIYQRAVSGPIGIHSSKRDVVMSAGALVMGASCCSEEIITTLLSSSLRATALWPHSTWSIPASKTLPSLYLNDVVLTFSYSCGISESQDQYLYLTGGLWNQWRVTRYQTDGSRQALPALNTGRYGHGCAGYQDSHGDRVLLVAGGDTLNQMPLSTSISPCISGLSVSSAEIFVVDVSSEWKDIEPLPWRLYFTAVASLNNKVYLTG